MKISLYNQTFSFWLDFLEVYATLLNEEYFENLASIAMEKYIINILEILIVAIKRQIILLIW